MFAPVEEQMEQIRRGAADIIPEQELIEKLTRSRETGTPLRVKLGLDPTAPDIHIGNAVPLHKLRAFQDLGHKAILIIGDFTAMVGDPSGANKMRPTLTHDQVMAHARTYLDQVGKIVDLDAADIVMNGDWFSKMNFQDILTLTAQATVAQCLERDDFAKRYKEGSPIGVHELLYPLMQGHDSVMIKSDVELGGTDQIFNILMGRELQKAQDMPAQIAVTNPLLEGLDGTEKMSKSKGNYIGIFEQPEQMFGKAMSIPDELMRKYFVLATDVPMEEIDKLLSDGTHPRDAKAALGRALVRRYHGGEAAEHAAREFDRVFREHKLPDDMPTVEVPQSELQDGRINIVSLVVLTGAAKSNSQAKRLVKQGGVKVGSTAAGLETVSDINADVEPTRGLIVRVGKKRFYQLG